MNDYRYKVLIDFKNFIPIGGDELQKAIKAFVNNQGVVFEEGATNRITAILPDYVAMMGWNYGYSPTGEDLAQIATDSTCQGAKKVLASKTKELQELINVKRLKIT